ncbi:MAG: hypothetical protein HIU82_17605 [Proteobacteria bacterium]|nr:hypothetical protein [Pseudomonadota bacterium]
MPPPPIGPLSSVAPIVAASAPVQAQRRGAPVAPIAVPVVPPPAPGVGNPSQHLDPGLGLVVIAFHNAAGTVTGTIPTAQQLQAYRRWDDTRVGPHAEAGTLRASEAVGVAGPVQMGSGAMPTGGGLPVGAGLGVPMLGVPILGAPVPGPPIPGVTDRGPIIPPDTAAAGSVAPSPATGPSGGASPGRTGSG